jgi:hypothetical protein
MSTFWWEWDNALHSFSVLCCTASTYFSRLTLVANVRFQNVFCSKPRLNCSSSPVSWILVLMDIIHSNTQVTECLVTLRSVASVHIGKGSGCVLYLFSIRFTARNRKLKSCVFYMCQIVVLVVWTGWGEGRWEVQNRMTLDIVMGAKLDQSLWWENADWRKCWDPRERSDVLMGRTHIEGNVGTHGRGVMCWWGDLNNGELHNCAPHQVLLG